MPFDQRERGFGNEDNYRDRAAIAPSGGLGNVAKQPTAEEVLHTEATRLEQRAAGLRALAAVIPREGLTGQAREAMYQAALSLVQR